MAKYKTPRKLIAPCSVESFERFLETGEISDVIWVEPSVAGEDGVPEWVIQIHVPIEHIDLAQLAPDPMMDGSATWADSLDEIGQCLSKAPVSLKADGIKVYQFDFCGDLHPLKGWQPHAWKAA